jgi:cyclic dehypoxanthinyl futalosine synthase
LNAFDAALLYQQANLNDLMHAASIKRHIQVPGNEVTYLVDRNINYSNICIINCRFCSFQRPPGHQESYTQTIDQISQRVVELEAIGGSRILMQGGVNPDLPLQWYIDLLSELRHRHPSISLDCFSPIEIEGIAKACNKTTHEVLRNLSAAGLHGLPGGGAEMLVDDIRTDVSPKKGSADNWLRIMGEAQSLHLTTSATNVFGFGESIDQRIEHMVRVRQLQDYTISRGFPGFTSFISWPVILDYNSEGMKIGCRNEVELGSGPVEYLRHVAISRLFFHNIKHIQASWPTMGMDVAGISLLAGADDVGSTMMEENVVSASGTTRTRATESELRQIITSAGFNPAKRDSDYNILGPLHPLDEGNDSVAILSQ